MLPGIAVAAVGEGREQMIPAGIAVGCQGAAAYLYIAPQAKGSIAKGIGSRGISKSGQVIIGIGVGGRKGLAAHFALRFCQAVHTVIGVLGTAGIRIVGIFDPLQQIGIGIVAVGSDLAQGVRGRHQAVAVRGIDSRAGDLRGAVLHGNGSIVAVLVVGEFVGNAGLRGCCEHIMIAVVGIAQLGAVRQIYPGQVLVGIVFIGSGLLLQVYHRNDIALGIIGIAGAIGFLE